MFISRDDDQLFSKPRYQKLTFRCRPHFGLSMTCFTTQLSAVFDVSRLYTATFCILDQRELNDSGYRTTFRLCELFSQS